MTTTPGEALERYVEAQQEQVEALHDLARTLELRNRVISAIALVLLTALTVAGTLTFFAWRSTNRQADQLTAIAEGNRATNQDTHRLVEALLPLVTPEARAAGARTSAFFVQSIAALCDGQNKLAATLAPGAPPVCTVPVRP